jgi:hypothetical protein
MNHPDPKIILPKSQAERIEDAATGDLGLGRSRLDTLFFHGFFFAQPIYVFIQC